MQTTNSFADRQPILWRQLQTPPDRLTDYESRVEGLRSDLSDILRVPLRAQHSDYSSDWIEMWLGQDGTFASGSVTPVYFCKLFVSTRGNLATLLFKIESSQGMWTPVLSDRDLPEAAIKFSNTVRSLLESRGYTMLSGEVLRDPIEGQFTALDGTPACVFEVFFSELG